MFGLYVDQFCGAEMHSNLIAMFTDKTKAINFMAKLKDDCRFDKEDLFIIPIELPKIDPVELVALDSVAATSLSAEEKRAIVDYLVCWECKSIFESDIIKEDSNASWEDVENFLGHCTNVLRGAL
jgi:hypothetical protein